MGEKTEHHRLSRGIELGLKVGKHDLKASYSFFSGVKQATKWARVHQIYKKLGTPTGETHT